MNHAENRVWRWLHEKCFADLHQILSPACEWPALD